MSLAEAKLQRQRKRIEEADATLTAPLALNRQQQASRGKGKVWKPFDYTADSTNANDGGVPISEIRVNTFRTPSRASSLTRSMSVLSQRTSETGPSDMERQDSAFTDSNGFQLYKGRRGKKNVAQLSAYADKLEERQTTVEATFDKREIYDVFGNALPGQEFIEQNVGYKDGQLQFIQHPNGDVSAHQWSAVRYIWENIGQFSNIRKKIEGQLASDRLKGETASQTLQQNTLTYFRTIAKQREANVMGMTFGPKEIQAAMPELQRVELAAASTGLKEAVQDTDAAEYVSEPVQDRMGVAASNSQDYRNASEELSARQPSHPQFQPIAPRAPRDDRLGYAVNYGQQAARQEDPFYSAGTYQQVYGRYPGGYPYGYPYYGQRTKTSASGPYFGIAQRPQGLDYNLNFPPTGSWPTPSQGPGVHTSFTNHAAVSNQNWRQWQQSEAKQAPSAVQSYSQNLTTNVGSHSVLREVGSNRTSLSNDIAAPQPKSITPLVRGTAMRDHLWKIGENAKERSLSQANIRTVLYDPFQSQQFAAKAEPDEEPAKYEASQSLTCHAATGTLPAPASLNPAPQKFFPTILAPQPPSSPVGSTIENNLQESSPDTYWSRQPHELSTPLVITSSDSKPTPQILKRPCFAQTQELHTRTTTNTSSGSGKPYEEELKDWWTSGNTFARQEEFYRSITSTYKDNSSSTTSPTAHLALIGPPSRHTPSKDTASFNHTTTRLLIPVLENLASYVQGPIEKRRDYFSQWSQPPEWCIDRSEGGNKSFFDGDWGQPPARVGRDPRYSGTRHWPGEERAGQMRGGSGGWQGGGFGVAVGSAVDRRFAFGGRY